jgi:hypothetical protein
VSGPLGEAELAARIGSAVLDAIRQVAREALPSSVPAAAVPLSPWMTPPKAAAATGVPLKAIRGAIVDGRLTPRLRNAKADPKAPKYLVNVEEVVAAVRLGHAAPANESSPIDLAARAERLRAKSGRR